MQEWVTMACLCCYNWRQQTETYEWHDATVTFTVPTGNLQYSHVTVMETKRPFSDLMMFPKGRWGRTCRAARDWEGGGLQSVRGTEGSFVLGGASVLSANTPAVFVVREHSPYCTVYVHHFDTNLFTFRKKNIFILFFYFFLKIKTEDFYFYFLFYFRSLIYQSQVLECGIKLN